MAFLTRHRPSIDRALLWLEYQDMNECGLLELPEAGNWMDRVSMRHGWSREDERLLPLLV